MISTNITIGNQSIILTSNDNRLRLILSQLISHLTLFDVVMNPISKKFEKVPKMFFYIFKEYDNNFDFLISKNSLNELLYYIHQNNFDKTQLKIFKRIYKHAKVNIELYPKTIPRENQQVYIDNIVKSDINNILIDLPPGYGKAEWVENKIRIPNGWKRMGDITIGDEVIAKDGTITKVTGVYPQGLKEMYKITFQDGRTNICCGEHLWKVYNRDFKDGFKILNTNDIDKIIKRGTEAGRRLYIDLLDSEQNLKKDYIIHPYVLGTLIGDGNFTQTSVLLHLSDLGVINRIKNYVRNDHIIKDFPDKIKYNFKINRLSEKYIKNKHTYREELTRLGLMGKYSYEKFLPKEYLNGSTEQRLELLRGLLDTDGDVCRLGTISYSTSSKQLALDVAELVRSLGGIGKISERIPYYTHNGIRKAGRLAYRVTIRMKNPSSCLTRVYRRKERLKEVNQYSKNLKLRINKIEPVGKLEAQCISIEHPEKLYVTEDYVVTHNTLIGFFSTVKLGTKSAILIKPSYLKKWVDDVKKYSPLRDDEFFIIKGGDSLTKLFSLSKVELENIKIYVISMRTITNYFNSYYSDDFSYPVTPYQFMEYTGIANILNDESHKEFESLFKIILWMDPAKLIGMSATMESDKKNMNYFYNLIYPKKHRLISMFGIKKYAHMIFYTYKLNQGIFIPHKSMMGYNHIMFEQNVMKNIKLLKDYVQMIKDIADTYYYARKNKSEKLLILFSTIDMCSIMTKAFKEHYRELSIKRYVEKDDYYDMLTGDVVISTNGSTGTAIDIPGLLTAIQTVPISDKQLNIQALGRLREIPGREVQYISLHCDNIQMHKVYKEKRRHILLDRVAFISEQYHDNKLGNAGVPNAPKDGSYKDFSKGYKQKHFTKYNPYNSKSKPKNSFRKNNKW